MGLIIDIEKKKYKQICLPFKLKICRLGLYTGIIARLRIYNNIYVDSKPFGSIQLWKRILTILEASDITGASFYV